MAGGEEQGPNNPQAAIAVPRSVGHRCRTLCARLPQLLVSCAVIAGIAALETVRTLRSPGGIAPQDLYVWAAYGVLLKVPLFQLGSAAREILGRETVDATGIRRSCLGLSRVIRWEQVYAVEFGDRLTVRTGRGTKSIRLQGPLDGDRRRRIVRWWRRRLSGSGRRVVPLEAPAVLDARSSALCAASLLVMGSGLAWAIAGRAGPPGPGAHGTALVLGLGLAAAWRAIRLTGGQVTLTTGGIRTTAPWPRQAAWSRVCLVAFGHRRLDDAPPPRHGPLAVSSCRHQFRWKLDVASSWRILAILQRKCRQAFFLDLEDDQVTPPETTRAAPSTETIAALGRLARRRAIRALLALPAAVLSAGLAWALGPAPLILAPIATCSGLADLGAWRRLRRQIRVVSVSETSRTKRTRWF